MCSRSETVNNDSEEENWDLELPMIYANEKEHFDLQLPEINSDEEENLNTVPSSIGNNKTENREPSTYSNDIDYWDNNRESTSSDCSTQQQSTHKSLSFEGNGNHNFDPIPETSNENYNETNLDYKDYENITEWPSIENLDLESNHESSDLSKPKNILNIKNKKISKNILLAFLMGPCLRHFPELDIDKIYNNFVNEDIKHNELSLLTKDDLGMLLEVDNNIELEDLYDSIPKYRQENDDYEILKRCEQESNYNNEVLVNTVEYMKLMTIALAMNNSKIKFQPPEDVLFDDEEEFMGQYLPKIVDEIEEVVKEIQNRIDAIKKVSGEQNRNLRKLKPNNLTLFMTTVGATITVVSIVYFISKNLHRIKIFQN